MLIIEREITPNNFLAVWEITEPLDYFLPYMPKEFFVETQSISKNRIKLQKAIKYFLLRKYFPEAIITKDANGKPFLSNNKHISVSHSKNLAGIFISDKNCGFDIEKITEKVNRVKHKFVNDAENQRFKDDKETLTLLWCCKETLYKLYNESGIDYQNTFDIQTIDYDLKSIKANVKGKLHTIFFERYEDYFLTFTIQ